MATDVFGAALIDEEGLDEITLTTSAQYVGAKRNWKEVKMYGADTWRILHCPALKQVLYYDATDGSYTDYTAYATDGLDTTHVPLDAMAADDYLYLGTKETVGGFYFDIGSNTNDEAADLDWEYCSTAVAPGAVIAFTDVAGSDTDGTKNTQTMDTDGVYAFGTVPAEGTILRSTLGTHQVPVYGKLFWYRFKPSIPLAAAVDINGIIPVYKNSNFSWREAGVEYTWTYDQTRTAGWAVKSSSGTPALHVSFLSH